MLGQTPDVQRRELRTTRDLNRVEGEEVGGGDEILF